MLELNVLRDGKVVSDVLTLTPAISLVIAILALAYKVKTTSGVAAKRRRELDIANSRLALWELRSRLEEAHLSGQALVEFRATVREAVAAVWLDTNYNLGVLASYNSQPLPIVGLSKLRIFLLAYKPVRHSWAYGYRLLYWLALLWFVSIAGGISLVVCAVFIDNPKVSGRILVLALFAHRNYLRLLLVLFVSAFNAGLYWSLGRRESSETKIRDLTRL